MKNLFKFTNGMASPINRMSNFTNKQNNIATNYSKEYKNKIEETYQQFLKSQTWYKNFPQVNSLKVPTKKSLKIKLKKRSHKIISFSKTTTEQLKAFTEWQLQALTSPQIKSFYYWQIKTFTKEQIAAFTPQQMTAFTKAQIKEIMNKHNLISKYTKLSFKNHHNKVNDSQITNLVNRNFNNRIKNEVIVSDLTYVQVNGKWNYICLLIDLFNREIIGHSVGVKKDASLVYQAFMQSNHCLKDIEIFHTDRGNEFNNKTIDKLLLAFNITRSLSKKGCPYDNAVAEATFKTFKIEFINDKNFTSLIQLKLELFDYINWYNNIRIHSTLNYLTPVSYQKQMSTKK